MNKNKPLKNTIKQIIILFDSMLDNFIVAIEKFTNDLNKYNQRQEKVKLIKSLCKQGRYKEAEIIYCQLFNN